MEDEENKISVWVCRDEKVVSGLSKRTTCSDVLKVLLEEKSLRGRSYCIVEKWRGFERVLPNKTKILRLWNAWGDEQENVRFVLVKQDASLPSCAPRSAEARLVPSRQNPLQGTVRQATMSLSPEKQRRVVRKAFRKLDRINRRRARALSKDGEKMETLVHLVVSQDHTIRQQVERIQELDREIELYEAKVHFDRVKTHGVNYVQETYLVGADNPGQTDSDSEQEMLNQLEEYAQKCEEIFVLQEDLTGHHALLDSIARDIQEELNQRWTKRRQELGKMDLKNDHFVMVRGETSEMTGWDFDILPDDDVLLKEDRIKTQLDTSLYTRLRLNTDLEAIWHDLDLTQEIWGAKDKEMRDLLEQVDSMGLEREHDDVEASDGHGSDGAIEESSQIPTLSTHPVWVEQARGLACNKECNSNDDDSDTGLSSMHSQDSDIAPICESLV